MSIERDSIVSVCVVMREFKKVGSLGRSVRLPNAMKVLSYKSMCVSACMYVNFMKKFDCKRKQVVLEDLIGNLSQISKWIYSKWSI